MHTAEQRCKDNTKSEVKDNNECPWQSVMVKRNSYNLWYIDGMRLLLLVINVDHHLIS